MNKQNAIALAVIAFVSQAAFATNCGNGQGQGQGNGCNSGTDTYATSINVNGATGQATIGLNNGTTVTGAVTGLATTTQLNQTNASLSQTQQTVSQQGSAINTLQVNSATHQEVTDSAAATLSAANVHTDAAVGNEAARAQTAEKGLQNQINNVGATANQALGAAKAAQGTANLALGIGSAAFAAAIDADHDADKAQATADAAGAAAAKANAGVAQNTQAIKDEAAARAAGDAATLKSANSHADAAAAAAYTGAVATSISYTDYVAGKTLKSANSYTDKAVGVESTRAQTAEAGLNTKIDNETTRATTAEAGLQTQINGNTKSINNLNSWASSVQAGAVGAGASVQANNSVALGAGSVATRDNTVSVGSQGNERQVTNVAAGTQATDAVNVAQLQSYSQQSYGASMAYTDQRINSMQSQFDSFKKDTYGGVAAAIAVAGLPQPTAPGRSMVSVATSNYHGQQGFAAGYSYVTQSEKWVIKASVTSSMRSDFGAVVGAGYQF